MISTAGAYNSGIMMLESETQENTKADYMGCYTNEKHRSYREKKLKKVRNKNYRISFLVLTFIFFVFPSGFHMKIENKCASFLFFLQNLGIHKINKFAVALKLNLNCILYVFIHI